MKRHIYIIAAFLVLAGCSPQELGPTIPMPEEMDEGSPLETPGVRIIDVGTDSFTADWEPVPDALEYEYTFDGGEPQTISVTNIVFSGLSADTEHVLNLWAKPRKENGRLPSLPVSVTVITSEVTPLDKPNLTVGSPYSSICVISWGAVQGAVGYECTLGERKDTTTKTFTTYKGLIEGREYTLEVRSLCGDNWQRTDSEPSLISFKPVNDGSDKMFFSSFSTASDALSFNVYANQAQYYWYDIVSKVKADKYASQQARVDELKASLDRSAEALVATGMNRADAYASVLKSGSANVRVPAYASMTYSMLWFAMDLEGNVSDISEKELTTPADLDSDGPFYASPGDWFTQTVMLGATAATSADHIYFTRKGTDVVSINYMLYSTSTFIKTYGDTVTDDVVNRLKENLTNNGSTATEDALAKVNSAAGYSAGYANREAGTSYTVCALATNSAGQQILCINSIKTRLTTDENSWITYALQSKSASGFVLRVKIAEGIDAVSGKFLCAPNTEITTSYTRAQYPALVLEKGTPLTTEQLSDLCTKGYATITVSDLEAATSYYIGTAVTDSAGDTTVKSSTVSTK